jgi:pyridoxamine 5'-phosphate oxidase
MAGALYIDAMTPDDLIPPSPRYDPTAIQPDDDAALFGADEPFALFADWLNAAKKAEPNDPNAMALATVDASGMPDVRMVLLKDVSPIGFVFYTNADSAKGRELAAQPQAALCFHWKSLRRQVRVRGVVGAVPDADADAYFQSRDRGARIGAWASKQSQALEGRFALEARIAQYTASFGLGDIPRPANWRGYRLAPVQIEFWRDRPFRLHDRLQFVRAELSCAWAKSRLYP